MAGDKNNSKKHFDDNENQIENVDSTLLDNEKELEKYGVWVKAGPEEIDDIDEDNGFNLSDLEEDGRITDEEELILGELEKELSEDNSELSDTSSQITDSIEDSDIDLNISDIEDLELNDIMSNEILETTQNTEIMEEPFDLDIDFDDDLSSLDELETEENDNSVPVISSDSEIKEQQNMEELELDDLELDDLELDNLDELELDNLDNATSTVETAIDSDISSENVVEPDIDISILDENMDLESVSDLDVDLLLEEDSQLTEIDEGATLDLEEELLPASEPDISTGGIEINPETDEDFDETEKIIEDLTDFEDMDEPDFEPKEKVDKENLVEKDIASEILLKIEKELLSIKSELHDVKKELSTLRPDSPGSESISKEFDEDESGFFEEDEDETIALTGDELDNILNTADIIEENGSETEIPDDVLNLDESINILDNEKLLIDNDDIIEIDEESTDNILEIDSDIANEKIDLSDLENIEIIDHPVTSQEEPGEIDIENHEIELDNPEEELIDLDETVLELDSSEPEEELIDLDETVLELDSSEPEEELIDLDETVLELDDTDIDLDILDSDVEDEELVGKESEIHVPEASEPEMTTSIDMELPEMQEDDLSDISPQLKTEIKSVLSYMDQLLESLPDEKIDEFANSEHYEVYKRLFEELGLN